MQIIAYTKVVFELWYVLIPMNFKYAVSADRGLACFWSCWRILPGLCTYKRHFVMTAGNELIEVTLLRTFSIVI